MVSGIEFVPVVGGIFFSVAGVASRIFVSDIDLSENKYENIMENERDDELDALIDYMAEFVSEVAKRFEDGDVEEVPDEIPNDLTAQSRAALEIRKSIGSHNSPSIDWEKDEAKSDIKQLRNMVDDIVYPEKKHNELKNKHYNSKMLFLVNISTGAAAALLSAILLEGILQTNPQFKQVGFWLLMALSMVSYVSFGWAQYETYKFYSIKRHFDNIRSHRKYISDFDNDGIPAQFRKLITIISSIFIVLLFIYIILIILLL